MLKDPIDLASLKRVLVVKLRHHGDVLLSSPVFSTLRRHAPHLEIDALVYRDTAEMLSLHPDIAQLHTIDRQWRSAGFTAQLQAEWQLFTALRARRYDLVVHLTEHPRGAWLRRLLGARYGVARRIPGAGRLWKKGFTHFYPLPKGKPRHTVELHLDALRRIGIQPDAEDRRLVLVPGADAEATVAGLLAHHQIRGGEFIHFHPTSRWLFKCWPTENMTALIAALQQAGHAIVVTAAPDAREIALVEEILRPLTKPVINLTKQLSLKQLAALTAQARLFIGVDSAPMHIAAAMQTPTLALFGPSGDREWGPWKVLNRTLVSDHTCRPCGNDGCGGGKISECLAAISVDQALFAANELLRGA